MRTSGSDYEIYRQDNGLISDTINYLGLEDTRDVLIRHDAWLQGEIHDDRPPINGFSFTGTINFQDISTGDAERRWVSFRVQGEFSGHPTCTIEGDENNKIIKPPRPLKDLSLIHI